MATTITICGAEVDYDPQTHIAKIYCSNCGHLNEVEVWIEKDVPNFQGFVCDNCNHYNSPSCD